MLRVLLDDDNDIPVGGPKLVSGVDSAATALRSVFSTQAGEWPYDLSFGTQWRTEILRKFFDAGTTRSLIAATANTVPDIQPVSGNQVDLDLETNAADRQVDITLSNVIVGDDVLDITVPTVL